MGAESTPRRRVALAALAVLVAAVACSGRAPTQLVVRVESDLAVPGELDRVVVDVEGCGDDCRRELALRGPDALPLSFGVAPRDGDARRRVRLMVEGRRGEATVVRRVVETGFVPSEVRLLVVRLEAACAARACEPGRTCVGGECVSEVVDVETLPRIEPGEELEPRDAGVGAITPPGDGGEPLPVSCEGLPDGPRIIDPDGPGGQPPFETWCDGGWTLLLKADGDAPGLGFDALEWELEAEAPFGSSRPDARENALLASYWRSPVRRLRFVASDGATAPRSLEVAIEGLGTPTPLARAMRAGDATLGGDADEWAALVGLTLPPGTVVCDRRVPVRVPEAAPVVRVRLGLALGTDASCSPVVAWAGVGASTALQAGRCDAFSHTAGGARLCGNPPALRVARSLYVVIYGHD